MMAGSRRLFPDCRGNAAAELALSLPILLILLFGAFELGNFFLSEHVVQKSVRDASRYAARLSISPNYTGCDVSADAAQRIRNVARTGAPDGSTARLRDWSDEDTDVTIECDTSSSWASGGTYANFPDGAPVITVSATVPYNTLFGAAGLGPATLNLNAQSQAAVFGA